MNNGKGFLKYNSNKLYILDIILLFLFQFSLLYKNNTFQAIHSFIHFQTKTSCRTCEIGFLGMQLLLLGSDSVAEVPAAVFGEGCKQSG